MKVVIILVRFGVPYICLHLLFVFVFKDYEIKFEQKIGRTLKALLQSLTK